MGGGKVMRRVEEGKGASSNGLLGRKEGNCLWNGIGKGKAQIYY